jgi:membrane protease YdiL (CAAX protease family)
MLLALAVIVFVVVLAILAIDHFAGSEPPASVSESSSISESGDSLREAPLWLALVIAAVAGISEEFVYRGYVIEEMGELIHSRRIAAGIATLFFGLMHVVTFGWSLQLIYPGLIGAVITVLYLQRRNLPLCMLLHALLDSWHAVSR